MDKGSSFLRLVLKVAVFVIAAEVIGVLVYRAARRERDPDAVPPTPAPAEQHQPAPPVRQPDPPPRRAREPEGTAVTLSSAGTVKMPLVYREGLCPAGAQWMPRYASVLSNTPPPSVTRPLPRKDVLYGTLPFEGIEPVTMAIAPATEPGAPATLYLDRNRNGDMCDDDPPSYIGTGTSRSGYHFTIELPRHDGSTYPHLEWVWTSIPGPLTGAVADAQHGVNMYSSCYRAGWLTTDGRTLKVFVPDWDGSGRFESERMFIDWNGNNKAEDPEWLAAGELVRTGTRVIRLDSIDPYGDAAFFTVNPPGILADKVPEIGEALSHEPVVGNRAIEIDAADTAGARVLLADYRGKVVLLDFWATWCMPCRREMPAMKALASQYADKDLVLIGISLDKDQQQLSGYVAQESITWRQVFDGKGWQSDIAQRYRVSGIPHTVLINRQGYIAAVGLTGERLAEAVQKELGPATP